ncbi:MAG: ABC transporter substrate binding protein, partial [Burkholderiales bacterium]
MTARRDFVGLIVACAVSVSRSVRAQPAAKLRVAFVHPSVPLADMVGPSPVDANVRAFLHRLRELGYVEGRDIAIERRSGEGQLERLPVLMKELVELHVDVIVAVGNAANEAQLATTTIPIVAWIDDPVGAGLTSSLARPTRNATGVSGTASPAIYGKRLQLLKEV